MVEIVQELEIIGNHTKDAAAIFTGLDEAHKFPREYIALLAEYFNRSIFVKVRLALYIIYKLVVCRI